MDGRVLSEALVVDSAIPATTTERLEVARKFPSGEWRQHLRISRVGETIYFDQGNGAFEAHAGSEGNSIATPTPTAK